MTNSSDNSRRGYFNALASGNFKTGADGRKLFYPLGALGRGYIIPSDEAYERLHRWHRTYMMVSMTLIIGAGIMGILIMGTASLSLAYLVIAMTAVSMVLHMAWGRSLRRGLERSEERLTWLDSLNHQARMLHPAFLRLATIGSLVFVAAGIAMLITQPDRWMVNLSATIFFACCAACLAGMLVLRRRSAGGQS